MKRYKMKRLLKLLLKKWPYLISMQLITGTVSHNITCIYMYSISIITFIIVVILLQAVIKVVLSVQSLVSDASTVWRPIRGSGWSYIRL